MQISTVNETLLIRAASIVVGPDVTNTIIGLYVLLDQAAKEGYELGHLDAQEGVESAINAAWDHGYDVGEADADDSYIQGVADARANPQLADYNVSSIINELAQNALNGEYDADLVQDSGDAQEELDEDGYIIGG